MDATPRFGFLGENVEMGLWVAAGIGVTVCPIFFPVLEAGGIGSGITVILTGMGYTENRWNAVRDTAKDECMKAFYIMACFTALSIIVGGRCDSNGFEACRLDNNSSSCFWYDATQKACWVATGIFGLTTACLGIERMQMSAK